MAIEINAQYTKFAQFAEANVQNGNEEAIARDGGEAAGGPLAGRKIVAADKDYVRQWLRPVVAQNANNAARELFRRAVRDMFGGNEANIPENVRQAMKLNDYGGGHPLTARRIMFVKVEVDRVLADAMERAGSHILAKITARERDFLGACNALGTEYAEGHAGFTKELMKCRTAEEFEAVFQLHEAEINSFVEAKACGYAAQKVVDAALADSGVTDAKVLKDARDTMLARVKARPAEMGQFQDFLSAVKAETAALVRTLEGIAKIKANAQSVVSTTVSAFSGIGKTYLMNNLRISSIEEKLRLLYNDVRAKVRGGEVMNIADNLNKANDIVSKFALGKAEVLKGIDGAGLDPAECAHFKLLALRDPSWKDTDVVSVAKGLAGNETLKKAAQLLVSATGGEALNSIDDQQLRDIFLAFGKTLTLALRENYAEHHEKWASADYIETRQRLCRMVIHLLGKEQPALLESLARLAASPRADGLQRQIQDGLSRSRSLLCDYNDLKRHQEKGDGSKPPALVNPGLEYDAKKHDECIMDVEVHNMSAFLWIGVSDSLSPIIKNVDIERHVASVAKGREMVAKYAGELTQETIPVLARLVRGLDWRPDKAAESEEIVKKWVADMKTWRDIIPGTQDASGVENVLNRRMNGYIKELLTKPANFTDGLFTVFLMDLGRDSKFVVNGRTVRGKTLEAKLAPFRNAIKDPEKLKAVSVVINQQLWADYTSLACRMPLYPIKSGMEAEPVNNIPGIEKFVSRDAMQTGMQLMGTGLMEFEIDVSAGGSTVTVRSKSDYPINGDYAMPEGSKVGTCRVTQELVIDFTGAEPEIRGYKVGQALV